MRTLYQLQGCPYALRARIALAEKRLPFETVYIDRANKPREVLEVSPSGGTPVLHDEGGTRLRDSAVIGEYLDERYPEPRLLPADPAGRAHARLAMDDLEDVVDAAGGLVMAQLRGENDPGHVQELRGDLHEALEHWDGVLAKQPFLLDAFSLADAKLYAHLLSAVKMGVADIPKDLPHLAAWFTRVAQRPAVAQAEAGAI